MAAPPTLEIISHFQQQGEFLEAMPYGTGHINEQWQSYWARIFADHGYAALDVVRPLTWIDERVCWWYRQNTLLYVNKRAMHLQVAEQHHVRVLDMVHPLCYIQALNAAEGQ